MSTHSELRSVVTKSSGTHQNSVNPKTGKVERVFVDLEAVYPNPQESNVTFSFEELRAKQRGWLDKSWSAMSKNGKSGLKPDREECREILEAPSHRPNPVVYQDSGSKDEARPADFEEDAHDERQERPRRTRIIEVNPETQTSKIFFSDVFHY